MSVAVHFRGPILFVHDDTELIDARIPDCRGGGTHADGTTAVKHYVGVLVKRPGQPDDWRVISAKGTLSIVDSGSTGRAKLGSTFAYKVRFGEIVDAKNGKGNLAIKLNPDTTDKALLTQILFTGGTVHSDNFTPSAIEIPYRRGGNTDVAPIPLLTSWVAKASVTITGAGLPITLSATGEIAYVFNWELQRPTDQHLRDPMRSTTGMGTRAELDFKWLYRLLAVPTTLKDWLTATTLAELPAPQSTVYPLATFRRVKTRRRYPPSSACDGGSWHEPPI